MRHWIWTTDTYKINSSRQQAVGFFCNKCVRVCLYVYLCVCVCACVRLFVCTFDASNKKMQYAVNGLRSTARIYFSSSQIWICFSFASSPADFSCNLFIYFLPKQFVTLSVAKHTLDRTIELNEIDTVPKVYIERRKCLVVLLPMMHTINSLFSLLLFLSLSLSLFCFRRVQFANCLFICVFFFLLFCENIPNASTQ